MPKRLLVTGSRDHTSMMLHHNALTDALSEWGDPLDAVLVEGECPYGGTDIICRDLWTGWSLPVDPYPADWTQGKRAGSVRNQRMVDSGADLCLAFPLPGSRGTWDCVRRAEKAGIEVRVIEP